MIPNQSELIYDLMYATVCLAQDLTGETKFELGQLIKKTEGADADESIKRFREQLIDAKAMLRATEIDRVGIGIRLWDAFQLIADWPGTAPGTPLVTERD